MYLGKVVGSVWSTIKAAGLSGRTLYIVQPVSVDLAPTGRTLICTDSVGAGPGSLVYFCRGRESSFPFLPDEVPTDAAIITIVDELHVKRSGA